MSLITEDVHLPSQGKIYNTNVNPDIKIRAMTTNQEMKRLSHSERQYKPLCDIMDECIVGDMGISSYDLCLGDYQYLLHKLRIVTYGSDYPIQTICPYCGEITETTLNLDDLAVKEYTNDVLKYLDFELPVCKKRIHLKYQTSHSLDDIEVRKKTFKKNHPKTNIDMTLIYLVSSLIDTVDGEIYDPVKKEMFIISLNMKDTNYIMKAAEKINNMIGIDPRINIECRGCGVDYDSSFRVTDEFFGPSID